MEAAGEIDCPFCAERIKAAAKICRFCNRDLPVPPAAAVVAKAVDHPPRADGTTLAVLAMLGLVVLLWFGISANRPDGGSVGDDRGSLRRAIQLCWREQSRKSLEPSAARFAAGACEKMEADFRAKYGVAP